MARQPSLNDEVSAQWEILCQSIRSKSIEEDIQYHPLVCTCVNEGTCTSKHWGMYTTKTFTYPKGPRKSVH